MSELKPCPFCGGEAEINYETKSDGDRHPRMVRYWSVECTACGANMTEQSFNDSGKDFYDGNNKYDLRCLDELKGRWNKRTMQGRGDE